MTCPYEMMQRAVDIVNSSPHPTNKIAATLNGREKNGHEFVISKTNYWPASIESHFGLTQKIGNSSGTIHAETACILMAPCTKDSDLYLTDPPCPNCAKNIAEAGIKRLFIDHKGFEKDFAQRRGDDFKSMSMRIFAAAGISVFEIHRKNRKIIPVLEIPQSYKPISENPASMKECAHTPTIEIFNAHIQDCLQHHKSQPFCTAIAEESAGNFVFFTALSHPTMGYTHHNDLSKEGKYSFILQPANRLLIAARYYSLMLQKKYLFSSRLPTSREFVNLIGAGFHSITIQKNAECRDEFGELAAEQLKKTETFEVKELA